jgi:outer membrane autotransporter protein
LQSSWADAADDYPAEYLASASLSYEWTEKLGTYYEVAGRFNTGDPRGDAVVLGTGVTYQLNKNMQLDAGVNVGVTPAADRINPFVGLAVRF